MNPLEQIKQLKKAEAHFPGIDHPYHDNLLLQLKVFALSDTIFNQERLNKTQALAFNEEIRFAEEQNKIAEERQLHKEVIQYALLHPFLEGVTHHSPVLMLLSLVAIAALLVPLHRKVEKLAISRLVQKNKAIRLAAAKKTIQELDTAKDANS